jgi:hypothetical protein
MGISLILGMNACKSVKDVAAIALPEKSKNERLDLIINQALQYEAIASNVNFTIKPGKNSGKTSVDGQLKIIKDQAIQLSLKVPILGIEAFRVTLTPDKIIAIDRINKQYLVESMKEIQEKAPFDFDFYSFQALLSNQLFIAGKNQIFPEDYAFFQIQENPYLVQIENTDTYNTGYSFTSDYTNRIQNTQIYKAEWNSKMLWVYDDFRLTDNKRLFPMSMKMELNLPDDDILMNLSFKTVTVNSRFDLDYNYPVKYKRVSLPEVLKLIKNLQ